MDIYRAILTRPHTYAADIPCSPALKDLLDRMLAKDPTRRLTLDVRAQRTCCTCYLDCQLDVGTLNKSNSALVQASYPLPPGLPRLTTSTAPQEVMQHEWVTAGGQLPPLPCLRDTAGAPQVGDPWLAARKVSCWR